ncbi:MAG: outer membrane lipoprotein-sorting protein [Spirochaetia bacterium]|nr:outer membrane lipoprotein-sorting protein [Spirochaetia bacterium]
MKTKKYVILILISTILLTLTSPLMSAEVNAVEVMKKVKEVQLHDTAALDIILTLIETSGEERERRIQTLTRTVSEKTESITLFLSPASVKQTRFLTLEKEGEDEQYIYLPALKQSKRISAGESTGSFMGSDFSYADMSATTFDQDEATHTYLRNETVNNRDSYVIESLPFDTSNYGKSVVWVDTATYLPMKVELYDTNRTTLLKRLETIELSQLSGEWVASIMEMTTVATGHKTRIEIKQAKYGISLPSGYFTLQFLQTGRI